MNSPYCRIYKNKTEIFAAAVSKFPLTTYKTDAETVQRGYATSLFETIFTAAEVLNLFEMGDKAIFVFKCLVIWTGINVLSSKAICVILLVLVASPLRN